MITPELIDFAICRQAVGGLRGPRQSSKQVKRYRAVTAQLQSARMTKEQAVDLAARDLGENPNTVRRAYYTVIKRVSYELAPYLMILPLWRQGLDTKEIAAKMKCKEHEVYNRLSMIWKLKDKAA